MPSIPEKKKKTKKTPEPFMFVDPAPACLQPCPAGSGSVSRTEHTCSQPMWSLGSSAAAGSQQRCTGQGSRHGRTAADWRGEGVARCQNSQKPSSLSFLRTPVSSLGHYRYHHTAQRAHPSLGQSKDEGLMLCRIHFVIIIS